MFRHPFIRSCPSAFHSATSVLLLVKSFCWLRQLRQSRRCRDALNDIKPTWELLPAAYWKSMSVIVKICCYLEYRDKIWPWCLTNKSLLTASLIDKPFFTNLNEFTPRKNEMYTNSPNLRWVRWHCNKIQGKIRDDSNPWLNTLFMCRGYK